MKPYQKLDSTQVRGLIFDVDDTVTRGGILEASAFDAMHRLRLAGVTLVAVTGRPLGWTDVIARMWPVDVAVGENGAGWAWRSEGRAREGYYSTPEERAAQREALQRIEDEVSRAMPHVRLANDRGARRCDLAFDVGEEVELDAADIDRLVAIIERNGATSAVSTVHAHAAPGEWDKAAGVRRALLEVLSIDVKTELDRWVFVGDSGNDAAAFAAFPLSVGVANVRHHLARLPVPPNYVTDSDRGTGFAELATHLLEHRA